MPSITYENGSLAGKRKLVPALQLEQKSFMTSVEVFLYGLKDTELIPQHAQKYSMLGN